MSQGDRRNAVPLILQVQALKFAYCRYLHFRTLFTCLVLILTLDNKKQKSGIVDGMYESVHDTIKEYVESMVRRSLLCLGLCVGPALLFTAMQNTKKLNKMNINVLHFFK